MFGGVIGKNILKRVFNLGILIFFLIYIMTTFILCNKNKTSKLRFVTCNIITDSKFMRV